MNENIEEKLEEFLRKLKNNETVKQFQKCQEELLKDKEFLKEIETFHELNPYAPSYKDQKQKLFQNETYKEYLNLNQTLLYWTYEMSSKLKACIRNDEN